MNKLVPFTKFSKKAGRLSFLSKASVVVDREGTPLGFVFGRDAFITLLEHMDEAFEKSAKNKEKAYQNPAGKLIDLIEEKLPLNPDFVKELKSSFAKTKKSDWIPFEDVVRSLHV